MKKKFTAMGVLLPVISGLLLSCGQKESPQKESQQNVLSVPGGSIEEANNRFALAYYAKLKDKEKGNIFFSPYSISTALAMTYEGARGKTAEEIQSVFHFPGTDSLRKGNASAIRRYNKDDKKYDLRVANALWAQKDYRFLKEYIDTAEKYYSGRTTNLDFEKDPEGSKATINKWVEERTNGKIKNLISNIGPLMRLILTNAVYFKGDWVKPFEKSATGFEDFKVHGKSGKVPMMRQSDTFNYADNDIVQLLEMPYKGEDLSMLVLLPRDKDLKVLEKTLMNEKLAEWRNALKPQEVRVSIPRFKLETGYDMVQDLADMGMPSAFRDADFSGMDGSRDLFIAFIVHKAYVDVDEKGTEAAAATGAGMAGAVAPPNLKTFIADHPFIFLIQEKATGNILFMGRISEPSAAAEETAHVRPSLPFRPRFRIVLTENNKDVLTDQDIASYDWATHRIKLHSTGIFKWNTYIPLGATLQSGLYQKEFKVMLDDEELYRGKFWSMASSASYNGVVILDTLFKLGKKYGEHYADSITVEYGYPGSRQARPVAADPRNSMKLREFFEKQGKLRAVK